MNPEMIMTLSRVRSELSRFYQLAEERSFDNIDQFFFFDDMESIIEDCETIL